jgi:hypothetical protein
VSASPTWKWFANNADKVYDSKRIKEEDDATRVLLRQQAREWLNK